MVGNPQKFIPKGADKYNCGCISWDDGKSLFLKPCNDNVMCLVQLALKKLVQNNPGYKTILHYNEE
jgi:hypothetical protein